MAKRIPAMEKDIPGVALELKEQPPPLFPLDPAAFSATESGVVAALLGTIRFAAIFPRLRGVTEIPTTQLAFGAKVAPEHASELMTKGLPNRSTDRVPT